MSSNPNSWLVANMILKIRSLIEDFGETDFQVFSYTNSYTWTLREPFISEITQVTINGNDLTSGQSYVYNSVTNQITLIGVSMSSTDVLQISYTYNQYSDDRIAAYIRGALTWLSVEDYSSKTYRIVTESGGIYEIFPDLSEPKDKTGDLVCIITAILILPEYNHYRMPNLAINYPEKECREDKIRNIIQRYKHGIGIVDIIEWNRSPGL
jgi:hypothetical protein